MARKRRKHSNRKRRKHSNRGRRARMYNRRRKHSSRKRMYCKRKSKRGAGKYARFAKAMWKKHRAAYKKLGFKRAGKAIGAAWRKFNK